MKKILSLSLAALMAMTALPVTYAAETQDISLGTAVNVVGENDGYTITVPATLEAGESGQITANGAWHSGQVLKVTAPDSIPVSYNGQSIDVGVTFDGINQRGNDISVMNITKDITLEDVSTTFGTWTGVIEYNVEVAELITFSTTINEETKTYYAEDGMTYGTWINSEYNTDGYIEFNSMLGVRLPVGDGTYQLYTAEMRGGYVNANGETVYSVAQAIIKDGWNVTGFTKTGTAS